MIQLSKNEKYSHLANPPSHAICTSIHAIYDNNVQYLKLNYKFGNLVDGQFITCIFVPTAEITFPTPFAGELHEEEFALLKSIFENENKKSPFDFTMEEVDTICSQHVDALNGTVIS